MALVDPVPARATGLADATDTNTSDEEEPGNPTNAVTKLRLFPTPMQIAKLDQMFATNRAIYNKMVALSRKNKDDNTSEVMLNLRTIAVVENMAQFFRNNRRTLARHRMMNDDVPDSTLMDFKKAVKSSRALFCNTKARGEKTTYPKFKFKSKIDPSNTIEIRSRSIRAIDVEGKRRVRFHPTFFGLPRNEGIAIHERLPELAASIRLQRLREGEVYLIVPRGREFPQTFSKRVCTIDPGVRNFVTMYDPNGRTLSVTDSHRFLRKRFEVIDRMKSTLAQLENVVSYALPRCSSPVVPNFRNGGPVHAGSSNRRCT
ncbi:hypothetical protein P3T76_012053 [Phytophthora citrophthora]|uniref:Transposase putative helix-turn-helix domain-containing protein n=1 Tax=Phytophthora citrophthora TaxID=4793 RepID=A0AAD9LEC5_9STRA|nr:hypothetical protein P3T76_012053 [Phytophthora citrophthora]